jgi:mycothiol system anti-sigma-R factor
MTAACAAIRAQLCAFVDGELAPEERQTIDVHVHGCAACTRALEAERQTRTLVRRTVRFEPTPPAVRERLLARLHTEAALPDTAGEAAPPAWREWLAGMLEAPGWRYGLQVAAVALVVVAMGAALRPPQPLALDEVARHYERVATGDVALAFETSDLDALQSFYRQTGYFTSEPTVADLGAAGFQLRGGTLSSLGRRTATMSVYEGPDGRRILCHRLRTREGMLPEGGEQVGHMRVYTVNGLTVCIMRDRSVYCILASRMPKDEFIRLLSP